MNASNLKQNNNHTNANKQQSRGKAEQKYNNYTSGPIVSPEFYEDDIKNHVDAHMNINPLDSSIENEGNSSNSFCQDKDRNSLSFQSNADQHDDELRAYVEQFKNEIEKKFMNSRINAGYKFPKELHSDSDDSSLSSLKESIYYDLATQNKKYHLSIGRNKKDNHKGIPSHENAGDDLVDVAIQQLEKMGGKIIMPENFEDKNSLLYKALYKLIEKNLVSSTNTEKTSEKFNNLNKKSYYVGGKKICKEDAENRGNANTLKASSEKPFTDLSSIIKKQFHEHAYFNGTASSHDKSNCSQGFSANNNSTIQQKNASAYYNLNNEAGVPVIPNNILLKNQKHTIASPDKSKKISAKQIPLNTSTKNQQYAKVSEGMKEIRDKLLKTAIGSREIKKQNTKSPSLGGMSAPKNHLSLNNYKSIKVKLETNNLIKKKLGISNNQHPPNNGKSLGITKTEINGNSNCTGSNITNSTINSSSPKSNVSLLKTSLSEHSKEKSQTSMVSNASSGTNVKISNLLGVGKSNSKSLQVSNDSKHEKIASNQNPQKGYSKLNSKLLSKLTANQEKTIKNSDFKKANQISSNTVLKSTLYQKTQKNIVNLKSAEKLNTHQDNPQNKTQSRESKDFSSQSRGHSKHEKEMNHIVSEVLKQKNSTHDRTSKVANLSKSPETNSSKKTNHAKKGSPLDPQKILNNGLSPKTTQIGSSINNLLTKDFKNMASQEQKTQMPLKKNVGNNITTGQKAGHVIGSSTINFKDLTRDYLKKTKINNTQQFILRQG